MENSKREPKYIQIRSDTGHLRGGHAAGLGRVRGGHAAGLGHVRGGRLAARGGGLLVDEVEVTPQGARHAGPELAAQTHVQDGVDAAVEVGQAAGQRVRHVDAGPVRRGARHIGDRQFQDVQRQPTEEEAGGHGHDHLQGALGPRGSGQRVRLPVHQHVATQDGQEGQREAGHEPEAHHDLGLELGPARQALLLLAAPTDVALPGVHHVRHGGDQRQEPRPRARPRRQPRPPVVLAPDGPGDQHQAVQADEHQQQHAAVHGEVEEALEEGAGDGAEVPVVVVGQRHHEDGEEEAAQEVGQGEVEEPDRGDGAVHAARRHPHHQRVAGDAQHEDQGVEEQVGDLDGLDLHLAWKDVVVVVVRGRCGLSHGLGGMGLGFGD